MPRARVNPTIVSASAPTTSCAPTLQSPPRVSRERGRLLTWLPLALIVAGGTALAARWSLSVDEWRVMTDEMGYLKTALHMGDTLSPLPRVRGEPFSNYSLLYPALLAPVLHVFDMPAAFRIAHGINALLMASTAVPTYLLARFVTGSRLAALAAAAPAAAVPWLTQSMSLTTESVAYPTFAWASCAAVLAIARPRPRHDALALLAVALAYFARTQFVFLAAALPLAVVLHEVGYRFAAAPPRRWARSLAEGLRASVVRHPLLVVVSVLSAALLLMGPPNRLLGNYSGTVTSTPLLPSGVVEALLQHVDQIIIGIGAVPLALTLAFVGETLAKPLTRQAHAFAAQALVVVPATLLVATSFDVNYVGGVQERYAFYVVPLLLVGAAACVASARVPPLSIGLGAVATASLLAHGSYLPGGGFPVFASPVRLTWAALDFRGDQVGDLLGFGRFGAAPILVAATIGASTALIALLRAERERLALGALGFGLMVWTVALTLYVSPKVKEEHESLAQGILGPRPLESRDWIDDAVSPGADVGLVPSDINSRGGSAIPRGTAIDLGVWWDAEFWNKSVRRVYTYAGAATYAPFHAQEMKLDPHSGRLGVVGPEADFLAVGWANVRLAPEGQQVAQHDDLVLIRARRPYRAAWATQGVFDDGSMSGAAGKLVVYGHRGGGARVQRVLLVLASGAAGAPYRVREHGLDRRGRITATGRISFPLCVRQSSPQTAWFDLRHVNHPRLIRVQVTPTSRRCRTVP
jgi:hypothetical protein